MRARRHLTTGLVLGAVALGVGACAGPPTLAPQVRVDPDAPLRQGLDLLLPYDFSGPSLRGLRWLDNHAAGHATRPSGRQARWWLLRARLDWLTLAYVAPTHEQRAAGLLGLMEHMVVPHPDGITTESLFALIELLERHAEAVGNSPEHAEQGRAALTLLAAFRHLDRAPPWFEHLGALRHKNPSETKDFSSNAVLIMLADLHQGLAELDQLTPDQVPHAMAALMSTPCPEGLQTFASATLEERHGPLAAACGWPCEITKAAMPPREAHAACAAQRLTPEALASPDNEVVMRALTDAEALFAAMRALLQEPDPPPVVAALIDRGFKWLARLERHLFLMSLPEHRGWLSGAELELAAARYAAHPGHLPVILVDAPGGTRIATHPMAHLRSGALSAAPPTEGLRPYAWPGRLLVEDGQTQEDALGTLYTYSGANAVALLGRLKSDLKMQGLEVEGVIPALVASADAPFARVLAVADSLQRAGFTAMDVVVSDRALHRAGALRLTLTRSAGVDLRVSLGARDLRMMAEGQQAQRWATTDGNALNKLHLALAQRADGRMGRPTARAWLEIAPELPLARAVALIEACRYRLEVTPETTDDQLFAAPIQGRGTPIPLTESFSLVIPEPPR